MASLAPASMRAASFAARGPSTVNAAPRSAMKAALTARSDAGVELGAQEPNDGRAAEQRDELLIHRH